MPFTTIGIISDIHGNVHALDAVLADIKERQINTIVNLGDSFYGPLFPGLTANRLMESDIINIIGNEDRLILEEADNTSSPTLKYVKESLSSEHMDWLATFPAHSVVSQNIYLCHGSPDSDNTYLLEDVTANGIQLRSTRNIMNIVADINQSVVICGHSHIPRTIYLPNDKIIVNAGSIGLQAYSDNLPFPHRMETFSPHAKYVILTCKENGWRIEHISVPYDWMKAAQQAAKNNRADWAKAIATGRAC